MSDFDAADCMALLNLIQSNWEEFVGLVGGEEHAERVEAALKKKVNA